MPSQATAVCLQPSYILGALAAGDLPAAAARVVLPAFYHGSTWHVAVNMGSLLWKGSRLERAMGGRDFAILVAWCVVASGALAVAVAWLARDAFPAVLHSCAVGFSAVLFALKVVLNTTSDGESQMMFGLRVPTRHAAWAGCA